MNLANALSAAKIGVDGRPGERVDRMPNHASFSMHLVLVVGLISMFCVGVRSADAAPARSVANLRQNDLADVARRLPKRGSLRLENVPFEGGSAALELERFDAFAPDVKIIAGGAKGEVTLKAPDNAYFRGTVAGDPGSVAVLTARAKGGVRGLIVKNGVPWVIGDDDRVRGRGMSTRNVDMKQEFPARSFSCGTDNSLSLSPSSSAQSQSGNSPAPGDASVASVGSVDYTARIAVETDFEFFQLFGDTDDAIDYIGDLFAYSSTIYESEVNTNLEVSYIKLWTSSSDPWAQTSCNGVLNEFRSYWLQNNGGISRTTAHMLSGKPTGCGIAYLGVLCNSLYGFGVSGSLAGTFNMQSPGVVWDILVVSHEIGHNFNSPHTHCYNGVGGNSQSVDQCFGGEAGCYSGPTQLPCVEGPGHGCGSIMSYCHLLNGGYNNITLTFGLGFQYGTAPERVPSRMHDHVVTQAASYPGCLDHILTPTPTSTPSISPTNIGGLTSTPSLTSTPTRTPTRSNTPTITPTPGVAVTLQVEITPPVSTFDAGANVALSADGTTALIGVNRKTVGCSSQGAVFVYTRSGSTWTKQTEITASDGVIGDNFGDAVAINSLGTTAVIGAYYKTVGGNSAQGMVYVYRRISGVWTLSGEFTASDGTAFGGFGSTVAVSADGNTVLAGAYGRAYLFTFSDSTWIQQSILTSPNAGSDDAFGTVVALNADASIALIGAARTTFGANSQQGAAYLFGYDGSTWTQQAQLMASDGAAFDFFGASVALDISGSTVLIGAVFKTVDSIAQQGAAYLFSQSGSNWIEQAKIVPSDGEDSDYFGASVALSGDGNTAVVGSPYKNAGRGEAYVFSRNGTNWMQQAATVAADSEVFDEYGASVALSADSKIMLVGAHYKVAAYAYQVTRPGAPTVTSTVTPSRTPTVTYTAPGEPTRTPTNSRTRTATPTVTHTGIGTQESQLQGADGASGDHFGEAVAVSSDGNTAVVGASGKTIAGHASQGAAYIYVRDGASWTQQAELYLEDGETSDLFGDSVAISGNGSVVVVGAFGRTALGIASCGAAYVYVRNGNIWTQQAVLYAPDGVTDDAFGYSVALDGDGSTAFVGAPFKTVAGSNSRVGMGYMFARTDDTWTLQSEFNSAPTSHYYGTSVSLSSDGNSALAAATGSLFNSAQHSVYVLVRSGTTWMEETTLTADDAEANDTFGWDVALSGNGQTAAISAYGKKVGSYYGQGSVYIFERSGSLWMQQAELIASDGQPYDFFGGAVAVSGDGKTVLAGAYNRTVNGNCYQGAAYVYVRNGATWTEAPKLLATNGAAGDRFGQYMALSSDATTAVVGAATKTVDGKTNHGAAYVFHLLAPSPVPTLTKTPTSTRTNTPIGFPTITPTNTPTSSITRTVTPTPTPSPIPAITKLVASDGDELDAFGYSVALNADGTTAVVGAYEKEVAGKPNQGTAYVFVRNGSTWSQQAELIAADGATNDDFGNSVAVSDDGNTAIIGAPGKSGGGCAYIFVRSGTTWTQQEKVIASNRASSDRFGNAIALSSDGNTALIGAYLKKVGNNGSQGSAFVFTRSGPTWSQQQQLFSDDGAVNDEFGRSVALSSDGSTALVGAFFKTIGGNASQGAAYPFSRSGTTWTQHTRLTASDGAAQDKFGSAVGLSSDGNTGTVGAYTKKVGANSTQGAAYSYSRNGTTWTQQTQMVTNDGTAGDAFGISISTGNSGGRMVIGAFSKKIGNNTSQGAAYIFGRNDPIWFQQATLLASDGATPDRFGWSVAMSDDGTTALIGAYNKAFAGHSTQGAAYIFQLNLPPVPSATVTPTITFTPTRTPTHTATNTATLTGTHTRSVTPTSTPTNSSVHTASVTPTVTETPSPTSTVTNTPSATASSTHMPTETATSSPTATLTSTETATPTDTATITPTATESATQTATMTSTLLPSPTPMSTETASPTGTATITPSATSSPSNTATMTPTSLPTFTPTSTATEVNTSTPTPTTFVESDPPTPTPTVDTSTLCEPAPRTDCFLAGKNKILVIDRLIESGDKLDWKWRSGAAVPLLALGNPLVDAAYSLCFYSADSLVFENNLQPNASCLGRPCWKSNGSGLAYRDNRLSQRGLQSIRLRAAALGRSQLKVKGMGPNLFDPLPATLPVTLQLANSLGHCWSSTFTAPAKAQTSEEFKDNEP